MELTEAQKEDKFLRSLGYNGEEQDSIDMEYMKDIFWREWEMIEY